MHADPKAACCCAAAPCIEPYDNLAAQQAAQLNIIVDAHVLCPCIQVAKAAAVGDDMV